MPVKGVDLGSILSKHQSQYSSDLLGPLMQSMQWKAEQRRLQKNAEAQQNIQRQQELRLMNQAGLEQQFRSQEMQARQRQHDAEQTAKAQEAASARAERDEAHATAARDGLYKAIASGDQNLVDAHLQELQNHGYSIETGDSDEPTPSGAPGEPGKADAPSPGGPGPVLSEPNKPAAGAAVPRGKLSAADRRIGQGLKSLESIPGQIRAGASPGPISVDEHGKVVSRKPAGDLNSKKEDYHGLEEDSGMGRPSPGRVPGLQAGAIGGEPFETEGLVSNEDAAGAETEMGSGVPGDVSAPERLPPAMVEKPWQGVRVKDKTGKVIFELDPSKLGKKKPELSPEGALGALDSASARDTEELRAKEMSFNSAQKLIAGGMPPDKAYAEGRRAYEYELARLGKARRQGIGGGTPGAKPGSLSQKQSDKRFSQILALTNRDARLANIQKLNQSLLDSGTATENLTGKGGFAQLNGFVHIIKGAQGGRVTDNDMKQAYAAAMSKIAHVQHLYNQYATQDVPMPPEAIRNIQEAQRLTENYLKISQRKASLHAARSAASNPDIKYADQADRDKMEAWVASDLAGEEITTDEVVRDRAPAKAQGAAPPAAKPVAKKSDKQMADELIDKM